MKRLIRVAMHALALLPLAVQAAEPGAAAAPAPASAKPAAAGNPLLRTAAPSSAADGASLEAARGGTDAVNNQAKLGGSVGNNTANHVSTGANIIDNGAFANASGLPVVIQNSGANVLIQNATVINLQLH